MNAEYQRVITSSAEDRRDLFVTAARRIGTTEQNIEKDFWVCSILDALFRDRPAGSPRLLFKGGTSLSKVFGLIQRFSEDIDLTVFCEDLGEPISIAELEQLSGKKRRAKLDEIREADHRYLAEVLQPVLAAECMMRSRENGAPDAAGDRVDERSIN